MMNKIPLIVASLLVFGTMTATAQNDLYHGPGIAREDRPARLAQFAKNYVSTYAGLASVMVALVFLYMIASIFIYGGSILPDTMRWLWRDYPKN